MGMISISLKCMRTRDIHARRQITKFLCSLAMLVPDFLEDWQESETWISTLEQGRVYVTHQL